MTGSEVERLANVINLVDEAVEREQGIVRASIGPAAAELVVEDGLAIPYVCERYSRAVPEAGASVHEQDGNAPTLSEPPIPNATALNLDEPLGHRATLAAALRQKCHGC